MKKLPLQKKVARYSFACLPSEYKLLSELAESRSLTVSKFVRLLVIAAVKKD